MLCCFQTVLSGEVWKGMAISIDLNNVTVELLIAHEQPGCPEASLAKLDFIKSRLMYESFSDGSKDIDLVSHEILSHDTRYRGKEKTTLNNRNGSNRSENIRARMKGLGI